MNEPRRAPIVAVLLGFALVLVAGLVTLGFRLTTPGSSPWMRERKTTTVTRPTMEADLRTLKRGMTEADVVKVLGAPDRKASTGPFDTWFYTSDNRYEVKRFLLGILPVGGGAGSQSFTAPLVMRDGVLASAPYGCAMERKMCGEYARLTGEVEHGKVKVARGPSAGRSWHEQLCAITAGKTTEADVEKLLGPPDEIHRQGSKCVWRWVLSWSHGGMATSWSPNVWFRDGVVVETPYEQVGEQEAKEFAGWEAWK